MRLEKGVGGDLLQALCVQLHGLRADASRAYLEVDGIEGLGDLIRGDDDGVVGRDHVHDRRHAPGDLGVRRGEPGEEVAGQGRADLLRLRGDMGRDDIHDSVHQVDLGIVHMQPDLAGGVRRVAHLKTFGEDETDIGLVCLDAVDAGVRHRVSRDAIARVRQPLQHGVAQVAVARRVHADRDMILVIGAEGKADKHDEEKGTKDDDEGRGSRAHEEPHVLLDDLPGLLEHAIVPRPVQAPLSRPSLPSLLSLCRSSLLFPWRLS